MNLPIDPAQPIGILDSGLGGLSVAKAIKQLLPQESMIYFADTANLPYGDKPPWYIKKNVLDILHFFEKKKCKAIIIACHSATSVLYDLLAIQKIKIFNVIDPTLAHIKQYYKNHIIGLIGTYQTITSNIYQKNIQLAASLKFLITHRLAPLIETGESPMSILYTYLQEPALQHIHALILGCTHYALIQKEINQFYKNRITLIDAAPLTAIAVKQWLQHHQLINQNPTLTQDAFLISKHTKNFEKNAQNFWKKCIKWTKVEEL